MDDPSTGNNLTTESPSLRRLLDQLGRGQLPAGARGDMRAPSTDPRTPRIGCLGRGSADVRTVVSGAELDALHNEALDAGTYPLRLVEGFYFSETIDPQLAGDGYRGWVERCLSRILEESGGTGTIPVERLDALGRSIQAIDRDFVARSLLGRPLDAVHAVHGPNEEHPYSKITLCRTAIKVRIREREVPLLYEKYLVSYSYLDAGGVRRCTVTPIHSHPFNHEVSYFLSAGSGTRVVEHEFEVVADVSRLTDLAATNGMRHPPFTPEADPRAFHVRETATHEIVPGTSSVVVLDHFPRDARLVESGALLSADGLYRPHRVDVTDDPTVGTLYYAINNYWSPTGRVYMFELAKKAAPWRHSTWT